MTATVYCRSTPVFGCTATVIVLITEPGFPHQEPKIIEVERKIHRRGPRRIVERAARSLRRMQRVVSVEEHTRDEYLRAYGD